MFADHMSSIENTFINRLAMIWARRQTPSVMQLDRVQSSGGVAPARLREAQFSDFRVVNELKRRNGLSQDSFDDWERLWRRNPALGQLSCDRAIGWVLEAEGRPVGYLGNISLLYRYADRTLNAVTGCGFAVEPEYRGVSLCLVSAFYRQGSVDLFLTTTASEVVAKIARAFKSDPLPQAHYATRLLWVLQPYSFAQAVVTDLGLTPTLTRIGGVLASVGVGTDKILRRRWPRRCPTCPAVKEISLRDIGDDFQTLWLEKLNERPRLLADRSPSALRWHFEMAADAANVRVFCCYKNGELLGYAVTRDDQVRTNGMRRRIIADMLAKRDDPAILRSLWVAAYEQAKEAGTHLLEVMGFPDGIRQVCSEWKPYYWTKACDFYYKAADPILHKTLLDGMAWYATPFDGDSTL
jgi:hypothetical protein